MKIENLTFGEIYLIYVNDFLTIEKMAEYYNVDMELLSHWINCGKPKTKQAKQWNTFQEQINEIYFNIF